MTAGTLALVAAAAALVVLLIAVLIGGLLQTGLAPLSAVLA